MSLRTCPCKSCAVKFNGGGPLVTQRTIISHLQKQPQAAVVPSTKELIQLFGGSKSPVIKQDNKTDPDSSHSDEWQLLSLVLVAHLHIICGLSRSDSNTTLVSLKSILGSFDNTMKNETLLTFPIDVRTAIDWLKIEPSIYRTICCPGCFKIFPPNLTLECCDHQETARSRKCSTKIFNNKNKPLRQYSTQSFREWLVKFVQRESTEELLKQLVTYSSSAEDPSFRRCIWDGSIWS
ncbi:hypothetical protein DFH28DRAFT_448382 [Melampsora americana]|nr:hypothetical protein DFH28DRAFT_448382 [Melampsora americana]